MNLFARLVRIRTVGATVVLVTSFVERAVCQRQDVGPQNFVQIKVLTFVGF